MFQALNRRAASCLNWLLIGIFVVLTLDVLWGVGSRYLLGNQARWSEELARLLMVWLALLGAALATREQEHLGLDVLFRKWPHDVQRFASMFVFISVAVFAVVIMGWGGGQLVVSRFESGQMLPALNISRAWFYLALPVSGLLISLFSVEGLLSAWQQSSAEPESIE